MNRLNKIFATDKVFDYFSRDVGGLNNLSLTEFSLGESCSIYESIEYDGVHLRFMDLCTGSVTGTFKDWIASATIAYCKQNNITEFVTQSSGNTANALAHYCQKFGIKLHVFYLKDNREKIKTAYFHDLEYVKSYEVDGSEERMKLLTHEFSSSNNLKWLPSLEIQVLANSVRADILAHVLKDEILSACPDWHSQALSSAYGVIGFYDGLNQSKTAHPISLKLLGVQQSRVCPFISKFEPDLLSGKKVGEDGYLERTLFREQPTDELYEKIGGILNIYGGRFSLVNEELFSEKVGVCQKLLGYIGMNISAIDSNLHQEFSGLINLIGVVDAIDRGVIAQGEEVLVCLTGGIEEKRVGEIVPFKKLK